MLANSERVEHLRHRGVQINIEPLVVRHLIDTLFTTDEERAAFELGFQEKLATVLDEAEGQVDRMTLQAAVQEGSQLLIPGR